MVRDHGAAAGTGARLGPVAAPQLPYSLVERSIEREHVSAALELGMGVVPWAALANGFLSGKYTRGADGIAGDGRLKAVIDAGWSRDPSQRDWRWCWRPSWR